MKLSVLAGAATLAAAAALPSNTADAGGFVISVGGPGGGFTYANGVRGGFLPVGYGRPVYGHPAYGRPVYRPPVVYGHPPYYGGYPGPIYAPPRPVYYPPVYRPPVYYGYPRW